MIFVLYTYITAALFENRGKIILMTEVNNRKALYNTIMSKTKRRLDTDVMLADDAWTNYSRLNETTKTVST